MPIGMRSRGSQRMPPAAGRGGLQAMMMADMPDPGLARVAQETGGGYVEIRAGQDLAAAFAQCGRRIAQPISAWLRAAQARWETARHRGAAHAARTDRPRAEELRRAEELDRLRLGRCWTRRHSDRAAASRSSSAAISFARLSASWTLGGIFASPTCSWNSARSIRCAGCWRAPHSSNVRPESRT